MRPVTGPGRVRERFIMLNFAMRSSSAGTEPADSVAGLALVTRGRVIVTLAKLNDAARYLGGYRATVELSCRAQHQTVNRLER